MLGKIQLPLDSVVMNLVRTVCQQWELRSTPAFLAWLECVARVLCGLSRITSYLLPL